MEMDYETTCKDGRVCDVTYRAAHNCRVWSCGPCKIPRCDHIVEDFDENCQFVTCYFPDTAEKYLVVFGTLFVALIAIGLAICSKRSPLTTTLQFNEKLIFLVYHKWATGYWLPAYIRPIQPGVWYPLNDEDDIDEAVRQHRAARRAQVGTSQDNEPGSPPQDVRSSPESSPSASGIVNQNYAPEPEALPTIPEEPSTSGATGETRAVATGETGAVATGETGAVPKVMFFLKKIITNFC